ncbi:MAG: rhodanese-like domain-containing protein [Lachnospiraceae bacterium]|nr:rhodanese-like domain-containing protein [Lachnospiraceae bacterium]
MGFENIRPEEIFRHRGSGTGMIIDLRSHKDYTGSHIPGAVCIPYEELNRRIPELRRWAEQCNRKYGRSALILYCDRGNTSMRAARDLYNRGFNVKNVYGGISSYKGPKSFVDGIGKSR